MVRSLAVLTAMVVGAAVAFVVFMSMRESPKAPEEVVLRSFAALEAGDFEALRGCYTADAWAVLEPGLPAPDDAAAMERFGRFTAGLTGVRIEAASFRGSRAEVEAVVAHEQGEQRERFRLVLSGGDWLID